ncbi:hypothetical protein IJH02_02585 [Candidatus Saccharibacteria bacterium]|nr:hypothetical protein [Candidatus Saccharibacteria bacterium]
MGNIYTYGAHNREIVDLETDEILTDNEIRMMYPDVYYQYVAPPIEAEDRQRTPIAEVEKPRPIRLSAEQEKWWRENRPYLFYDGKTREQVFWAKLNNLTKKVASYAEKKRRGQFIGRLWHDVEFAWQMLDEAGELLGFGAINSVTRGEVTEDLKDPAIRRKYQRRIDRCLEAGEIIPVDTLYCRVHAGRQSRR